MTGRACGSELAAVFIRGEGLNTGYWGDRRQACIIGGDIACLCIGHVGRDLPQRGMGTSSVAVFLEGGNQVAF
jgi:hypothetical protein